MSTVYILGGGVAGLSAAHELAERRFTVVVVEKNDICGGKARSMANRGSGTNGRVDWPGEHGFRFFPGFYWHLSDTMSRIWFDQANNIRVLDNLVPATEIGIAQEGKTPFLIPASAPKSIAEWITALRDILEGPALGLSVSEARFFLKKLFCFLGSGPTRRVQQLETIPWWTYIEASTHSTQYQCIIGRGLSRSLVAMRPEKASTLTVMSMFVQIVLNIVGGKKADRVLNGPTSEVWINPWVKQLTGTGQVTILTEHVVQNVAFNAGTAQVTGFTVMDSTGAVRNLGTNSDFYICALPVDVVQANVVLTRPFKIAAGLVKELLAGEDGVDQLQTDWMSGVLYYLNRNTAPLNGHVIYVHSPWSLTSVSQRQFWDVRPGGMGAFPWSGRGNGEALDILSTIISAWDEPGTKVVTKKANACTKQEIFDETWGQLKAHLVLAGNGKLNDSDRVGIPFLDPAIQFDNAGKVSGNSEPLLINTANSRRHRPAAATALSNFFVASDYVATNTDLACMEAANEAARHAVNAVLTRTGSPARPCAITPLQEPDLFRFFQNIDEKDYEIDPTNEPLLCRYIDELLPGPGTGLNSGLIQILLGATSIAMLAAILYLLLK